LFWLWAMLILGGVLIGWTLLTAMKIQGGFSSDHRGLRWSLRLRGAGGWIDLAAGTGQPLTVQFLGRSLPMGGRSASGKRVKKKKRAAPRKTDRMPWVKAALRCAPRVIRDFFRQIDWHSGQLKLYGGFPDPALTGQLWGMGAVLSAMNTSRFELDWRPDFQQSSLCIDLEGITQFRPAALLGWGLQSAWMIWREERRSQRNTRRFQWSSKNS